MSYTKNKINKHLNVNFSFNFHIAEMWCGVLLYISTKNHHCWHFTDAVKITHSHNDTMSDTINVCFKPCHRSFDSTVVFVRY